MSPDFRHGTFFTLFAVFIPGAPGVPAARSGALAEGAEMGIGDAADVDFMQSAVGLLWRALLLLLGFGSCLMGA